VSFGRSVITEELWRPEVARPGNLTNFCVFWKNDPLRQKLSKFYSESFTASPINVAVFKVHEMLPTINGRNRAVFTRQNKQNFTCLSNCRYCADRAQNLPGPTPNNVPRVLQISSKSVHFRRSYNNQTREHRQIAP